MTYDHSNQPVTLNINGLSGTYVYDGHLRRVKEVFDGRVMPCRAFSADIWSPGPNVLAHAKPASKSVYSQAGELLHRDHTTDNKAVDYVSLGAASLRLVTQGGITTPTYTHKDHLGSPVAATDGNGDILWRETYTPYGKKNINTPENARDVGFTGHVNDDFGMVYMQARYYMPLLGRFLSPDPVQFAVDQPQMFNRYSYTENDPVNLIDPDGRSAAKAGKALINEVKASVGAFKGAAATLGNSARSSQFGAGEAVTIAAGVLAVAPGRGQAANNGSKVFRALAKGENPAQGLTARNSAASATPAQHVNGKRDSQFISTTKSEATATEKFNSGNGVVEIDLNKVDGNVIDISGGVPGASQKVNNFAKKDQEVLIEGQIPPEAIRVIEDPK